MKSQGAFSESFLHIKVTCSMKHNWVYWVSTVFCIKNKSFHIPLLQDIYIIVQYKLFTRCFSCIIIILSHPVVKVKSITEKRYINEKNLHFRELEI